MLAEVNIAINSKVATLVLRVGEKVKDEETWTFPAVGRTEAAEVAATLFADAYDYLNLCVHGDVEDDEQSPEIES